MLDPKATDSDFGEWCPPEEILALQNRRILVREALFKGRVPKGQWRGVAPGWPRNPSQAADSFADATLSLPLGLDSHARFRDYHPTRQQLLAQLKAVRQQARRLEATLSGLSIACTELLDSQSPSSMRGDEGEPYLLFATSQSLAELRDVAEASVSKIRSGQYQSPPIAELRIPAMQRLAYLYLKHFGQLPGAGKGPFFRLVERLFEAEGIRTTSLYGDMLAAIGRCRRGEHTGGK